MKKFILVPLIIILISGFIVTGCAGPAAEQPTQPATSQPVKPAETTKPAEPAKTTEPAKPTQPATVTPKTGGILTIIVIEGPSVPIGMPEHMAGMSFMFGIPMTDPLLKADSNGNPLPCLATDWKWSNDYKTITLTLRKGVKFHDGTDFNAQVVKWNFDREMAAGAAGTQLIESYEVVDDYTFRINLTKYDITWIEKLEGNGYCLGMMTSPTAVEKYGVDYIDWHPVGTGPFKFKEYRRDDLLEMERNPDYWGSPQPYIDGVKFVFIADRVTAEMAFEAGEADVYYPIMHGHEVAHGLVPKGYKDIVDTGGLMYVLVPSSGNPASPLSNLKVREAIDYAIDKEKIASTLFFGYADPRIQLVEKEQTPEPPEVEGRKYDPEKARALLAEAGYPDGFKLTMYCGIQFAGDDKIMVQSLLNAVGIETDLQMITPGKWIDMETNGWDDGLLVSVQGGLMGIFLDRFWWKPDKPNWDHGLYYHAVDRPDEMQTLIEQYLVETDHAKSLSLSKDIGQIMYDDCIAIPLYYLHNVYSLQPYVMDAKWGSTTYPMPWSYTDVWLDK
jgi:ABC-type transport system substrate-binding protein